MSQFKDLCIMFSYIYLLLCLVHSNTPLMLYLVIIVSILFCCKYFFIRNKLNNFERIKRNCLEEQRDYFISSLNHDLRIPAIAQLRALELLRNEKFGTLDSPQKEMVIQIEQSCRCILNLISLLINTYSMENNKHKLKYEKFNLSELVVSCFDELLTEAAEKQITFEFDGGKNLYITADREEIKKVIYNLLTASLTGSKAGEKVTVKINALDKKIMLNVYGNNNDYYANTSHNSQYTTIGQTIRMHFCKKIVEIHKGKIYEHSNKCNSFFLELPAAAY